ncbi:hypothetical protein [Paenibacillus silvae]|uniref:hypothetical protein n=1 Tax=Paenibacillus silvae TaxID=1325358 RepID=UPI002004B6AF|nr:hypothetical protein [Paenibacillus silvae]MCK6075369.1 hypothetical protein [Paenibacillus silvae]MCK6149756.1 hypothetical protein [Paenibacillus silvae]MCK6268054.1 hypothetical protein [Paenibacillus silvae]
MRKKKVLISLGGLFLLVTSLSLFAGVGAASKPVTFDASTPITFTTQEDFNAKKIPPGFDKKENIETGKKLGIDVKSAQSEATTFTKKLRAVFNKDSITVHQELTSDGDYLVGSGGSIDLNMDGQKHNLSILSSLVSHFELKNGTHLLTGSFETEIQQDDGTLVPSTVSFTSIVETGEGIYSVTMGTIEDGPVVLMFGDDNFATQEIRDIIRGQANFEEDAL